MTQPKSGLRSTEWWATVASYALGLIALFHFTGRSSSVAIAIVHVVAIAGPVIATAVYAVCRTRVKGAHILAIGSIVKEITAAVESVKPADVAAIVAAIEAVGQAFASKTTPATAAAKQTAIQQAIAHAERVADTT